MSLTTELKLPENLTQRRAILEEELDKTITLQTTESLTSQLIQTFKNFKLAGEFSVTWDFYPESDDGDSSYMSIGSVEVTSDTDNDFDASDKIREIPYSWKEGTYSSSLQGEIRDLLIDDSSDIYRIDMESIKITVEEGE